MKVSTRVAGGAALFVSLLLVTLALDMSRVRQLASAHRRLSEERFVAVTSTLDLLRTLELTEERLQKLVVTRDPAYATKLDQLATALAEQLALQRKLALPAEERSAIEALSARWEEYLDAVHRRREELTSQSWIGSRDRLRAELLERIDAVRSQGVTLLAALRAGIDREVQQSQREAGRQQVLSWILAGVAVLGGVLFVVLTLRSLNRPLSRLLEATRRVGSGSFAKVSMQGTDELAELAGAFDAMVERLDELDRMKRDFISHVSHELKTPLSAMQETNQLLSEELVGPLTPKQRRLIQLNLDAGRRLSTMLSRLLDVSRLEAGAVSYDVHPVALNELLSTAHQEFEARMAEKRLTAELTLPEQPVLVDADRDWLVQVFVNLLENAIKFSPADRRLWLAMRLATPDELAEAPTPIRSLFANRPAVLVTVADEGPGIPDEVRERIFERFFQVEQRRRAGGGVGLGLAICRDIVAAHGGGLWVANRPGGGSIFAVALPLSTPQPDSLDLSASPSSHDQETSAVVAPRRIARSAGGV
jgi:two-component system sensor histidine kinase GlrK